MQSGDYGDVRHPRQDPETKAELGSFLHRVGNAGFFEKIYKEYRETGRNIGELTANGVRFKYCIAWFAADALFLYFYPEKEPGKGIIFNAIGKPEFWQSKGRQGWSIDEANVSLQSAIQMIRQIIELFEFGADEFWGRMELSKSP